MQFCPTCGNILLLDGSKTYSTVNRLFCRTCPYQYEVTNVIRKRIKLDKEKVDDVIFQSDASGTAATTDAKCEQCGHKKAYLKELQTRSADEPATIFYKCAKCGFQWNEG